MQFRGRVWYRATPMKTWLAALAFCAIGLVLLLLVVLAPGGHAMEHVIYTWPS